MSDVTAKGVLEWLREELRVSENTLNMMMIVNNGRCTVLSRKRGRLSTKGGVTDRSLELPATPPRIVVVGL